MPAIAHSNPKRVYATIETGDGVPGTGRRPIAASSGGPTMAATPGGWSTRIGTRWARTALLRAHGGRHRQRERDLLPQRVLQQVDRRRRDAGGDTTALEAPGGDNHDMWIDPTNANRMVVAHDQGVSISQTRGRTWLKQRLPNAQMYHVTVDNQIPVLRLQQQAGRAVVSRAEQQPPRRGRRSRWRWRRRGGIPRGMWHSIGGGESGWATPDPVDPNIIWSTASGSGSVGGIVVRYEESRRQMRDVEVWPDNANGIPGRSEVPFRLGRAVPHLAARSQQGLYRQPARASVDGRRPELAGDQSGPDAERQEQAADAPAG